MNSILKIWRAMLPPNPSARPTLSSPPVPVSQPFSFQHLRARSSSTWVAGPGDRGQGDVARPLLLGQRPGAAEPLGEDGGIGDVALPVLAVGRGSAELLAAARRLRAGGSLRGPGSLRVPGASGARGSLRASGSLGRRRSLRAGRRLRAGTGLGRCGPVVVIVATGRDDDPAAPRRSPTGASPSIDGVLSRVLPLWFGFDSCDLDGPRLLLGDQVPDAAAAAAGGRRRRRCGRRR